MRKESGLNQYIHILQSWRTMQARLEEEHRSREEEAARVDRVEHRVS